MIKKIDILGISIDNYTVREAMQQVEAYLNNTVMNTIEAISMEMLVGATKDSFIKECIEQLDLAIVCDKEILKGAGVTSAQRMKETTENQFFTEFLKRIVRNKKTVYLIGQTRLQLDKLQNFLEQNYEKLNILGSYAMEECVGDYDGAVNEMNVASPDVIFSILPTPDQEHFMMENKGKMNAKIWYGLGDNFVKLHGVSEVKQIARKLLHKGMLRSMLSKYSKDEK